MLTLGSASARWTVLVIDSDQEARDVLRASLERRSFKVLDAPDPVSALTMLLWAPVDVIVLNLRVRTEHRPGPTAQDLVRLIRADDLLTDIPILTFSDSALDPLLSRVEALALSPAC